MKTPDQHLREMVFAYKDSLKLIDIFLDNKGKDLPNWPTWCFLPMSGWLAIISHTRELTIETAPEIAKLSAVGTWRYSQGIYRFPPALLHELADSPLTGDLPSETFLRLPEWCVYIETPQMIYCAKPIHGFWAHLEWDTKTQRKELRLLLNTQDGDLLPSPLHLGPWTIEEGLNRVISVAKTEAEKRNVSLKISENTTGIIAGEIAPFISILLYLCSDEPEIENTKNPTRSPAKPAPIKTKTGLRLFPADGIKVFDVGKTLGKLLTETPALTDDQSRTVRPHVRRGHWHTYRIGAGREKTILKWLHPAIIGK